MPRQVATLIGVSAWLVCAASSAAAQSRLQRPVLVRQDASASNGRVHGLVRDDLGHAIAGASVVAVGGSALPAMARSDRDGQFTLSLLPGQYVLRAARDGYVSTYREPVSIHGSTLLERVIVLVRQGASAPKLLLSSAGFPSIDAPDDTPMPFDSDDDNGDRGHNETAWRLRHLPPTALRDVAETQAIGSPGANGSKTRPSFGDSMMGESARAAASFFTGTNFTGELNFLTTSSLGAQGSLLPTELPHGIAYVAVGAPVGSSGDWSVRGAMTAGSVASWVVLGEYAARDDQLHAVRLGVSYSSQPSAVANDAPPSVNNRVRSVGGIYAFDRWHVRPALDLDYGMRFDRYDYVEGSEFVSPEVGARLRVLPETHLTVLASEHAIAPGANEFLPPPSSGLWIPPERTFTPLVPGSTFQAERVRDIEFGIDQRLASSADAPVVGVHRFRESSQDQIATLFGVDGDGGPGHYAVATPGSLVADGWIVRVAGTLTPRVAGTVEYTTSRSEWNSGAQSATLALLVPSVVRPDQERLHDLAASVNATIPETATRIAVSYRVNAAFAGAQQAPLPSPAGRFNVELRQALPLRPTKASRTELIIVVRNMFHDPGDPGSVYDELLTISPPLRIMGGVQVKF